jgi:cobalt/nickel transport system permease protein
MHMADALLSPGVGATFWALSGGLIAYSSRKMKSQIDDQVVPLMGVLGAFIFAAQMINFTIPGTGSSGHLGGGMILAILLGPYAAFVTIASVLIIQALFFADGGLLALGCNMFNLGFFPCFVAYPLIYKTMAGNRSSAGVITTASIISAVAALQLGALFVVLETVLSGRTELPFKSFVLVMQPIHLGIGIVEGLITAAIVNFVRQVRPEILESALHAKWKPVSSLRNVVVPLVVAALVTGGVLSWFASSFPDGLEWSVEKVYGRPELPESHHGIATLLGAFQKKTAFLPDYGFEDTGEPAENEGQESWPAVSSGTSVAGLVGGGLTAVLALVLGLMLKKKRDSDSV